MHNPLYILTYWLLQLKKYKFVIFRAYWAFAVRVRFSILLTVLSSIQDDGHTELSRGPMSSTLTLQSTPGSLSRTLHLRN